MPNIKSAIKRVRTSEDARLRNHSLKTAYRTKMKRVEASFDSPEKLPQIAREAISAIDRAAKGGAIHARAAARHKSRLMHGIATATGVALELGASKSVAPVKKASPKKKPSGPTPDSKA